MWKKVLPFQNFSRNAKKLVLVSTTSVLVTNNGDEEVVLRKIPCIHYPVQFQKNKEQVKALLDSRNKINAMNSDYVRKLGLNIWSINVRAQKIDSSTLETLKMLVTDFLVEHKVSRPKFFEETFLVANTKFELILRMFLLKMSNANESFGEKTLTWKFYTINQALLTMKQVQIVNPKDFVIAALDAGSKTFIIHVAI